MIFFDIGNTLENETPAVEWRVSIAATLLSNFGVSISEEEFHQELRSSSAMRVSSVFKSTIKRLAPNKESYVEILKNCIWRKDLLQLRLGAKEVVTNLGRYHKLGIIANQSEGAQERFSSYGILDKFSTVISSHDVSASKPDPKIFEIAINQSGANPYESFMVGDRLDNDIGPAKEIGFNTVRILGCYNDSQIPINETEEPDFTIQNLHELEQIIANQSVLTTSETKPPTS